MVFTQSILYCTFCLVCLIYVTWCCCFFPRYDHLCKVITTILDERPSNAGDAFEYISKNVKKSAFKQDDDVIQDKYDESSEVLLAKLHNKLFTVRIFIAVV